MISVNTSNITSSTKSCPKIGLLYLDHVLRFFNCSNFKGWPEKIEQVVYHWGNDKQRFINEVKRKKIEVLIGNIPATAYETFRAIARELPNVRFIPSLDTQFSNKSKENVTHFCEKYQLPVPLTKIFYQVDEALEYLTHTDYPKIVKRSYGPSNYGGYFVHKVDTAEEALRLFSEKRYYPAYIQDFVPMKADIRVMLVGHQPMCAFWRRPPEGEWLTNTSQGGSMDYQDIPEEVLEIAVKASKAANAEYWACDIAVSTEDEYTILECATAFAAFPYIRDWIGQYLMWLLNPQKFTKPHIVHKNWEELGKIDSSLLRTMRHITFGQPDFSTDTSEYAPTDEHYRLLQTHYQPIEEWPSEAWNFQDMHNSLVIESKTSSGVLEQLSTEPVLDCTIEEMDSGIEEHSVVNVSAQQACLHPDDIDSPDIDCSNIAGSDIDDSSVKEIPSITHDQLVTFFLGVKGIGQTLANEIVDTLSVEGTLHALNNAPQQLTTFRNLKQKKLKTILADWHAYVRD
ncbi:ATP-grasp domain-containing protein [Photobacterium profundum]|uniref:ATP-grasp domain-containing protein n=1 Tax=Photobacterium profundum (strain SS9) TaxID=298386 RepID=Q6LJE9_PHOPR|nr:hypothetical protein [Photobacterium profundum]CAG22581.1 hypothetical protein PBPRB0709 [Photobacterium profundum SS9]